MSAVATAQDRHQALDDFTPAARAAWARRVLELTPPDCTAGELEAVQHRAYCEIEPHGKPWRAITTRWDPARRIRFARLALSLAESGTFEPSDERQAFLAIAAEDDPPGLPGRDPARVAVEAL